MMVWIGFNSASWNMVAPSEYPSFAYSITWYAMRVWVRSSGFATWFGLLDQWFESRSDVADRVLKY